MKKILSFLVIILTISHVGFSRTRDINEMKQIAANALKQQYGAEKFNGVATPDFTVLKETANYCLLTNNSVGTVIVAKNDLYGPVLGCSTSPCDLNNLPCGFKWWLEAIDGSLSGNLKAKRVPVPSGYPLNVDPLVQVNWGQQSPFNNMCPNGCLVGCVAVAMGQIMSAYRCPNVGNGSYSYNLGGQVLSVNFGESNYDWDMIMGGDYNEIAKLLFHCGVAVRTNYGTSVSTAFMPEIRSALINYFRYTSDAAHKYRSNYSDDEWFNMIYRNLASGHPIAYSGDNSESYSSIGHAFVVDGYNNDGEMHINWGWNGNMDGFFDLSSINYSYNQDMVCDIVPSAYQPSAKPYLTLDMGGDGVVKLIADEGSSYEFIIEVEDNWMLDKVYFNSQDVTGALNDNTYTTPAINQNATIRVVAHDTTPQPIFGDVNDDGEVNIADVNAVIDAIISNRVVDRADVNSDGEINIADVNTIIDLILFPLSASKTFTVNGVTFKMIAVKGGSFTMGATTEQDGDVQDNERPAHKVNLSDYQIGETEVTQELWVAVMGSNPTPASFQGDPNRPVSGISWYDCQEFIAKLNELTGQSFRLPTEAEWEYAASGGNKTHGYKYAGSNDIHEVAWYDSNSTNSSYYGTFPVATKLPNELGLYDMSGNAMEWCQDWYGNYDISEQTNPKGPDTGSARVSRGGSWVEQAPICRVTFRSGSSWPERNAHFLGLRLAL